MNTSDQLDFAFAAAPPRFARARRKDPSSSHAAAAAIEASGIARSQAQDVLNALKRYPMSTTAELAKRAGLDRYAVARRAPELAEASLIVRHEPDATTQPCAVSGKRVVRWSLP